MDQWNYIHDHKNGIRYDWTGDQRIGSEWQLHGIQLQRQFLSGQWWEPTTTGEPLGDECIPDQGDPSDGRQQHNDRDLWILLWYWQAGRWHGSKQPVFIRSFSGQSG